MSIKPKRLLLIITLVLSVARTIRADQERAFRVTVTNVSIRSVATDRLTFNVGFEISSEHDVVARNIVFSSFQLSGLPFYMPPITEKLELKANRPEQREMHVTIYFRDLNGLEPIVHIVESENVEVRGRVRADVELGVLATLLRLARTASVETPFESLAQVRMPGGAVIRTSTLRLLRAAAMVMTSVGPSVSRISIGRGTKRRRALIDQFKETTLLAGTAYTLRNPKGETQEFRVFRAGTRISKKYFLLSTELLEPWRFDSEAAQLLASGEWEIVDKDVDFRVWFAGDKFDSPSEGLPPSQYTLRRQSLRLITTGKGEEAKIVILNQNGKSREVKLRNRGARQNVALFEVMQPPPWKGAMIDLSGSEAEIVGSFRTLASWHSGIVTPELIPMAAQMRTGQLILVDAIDSSGWGAPLFSEDRLVGMVLDERTGIELSQIKKLIEKTDATF